MSSIKSVTYETQSIQQMIQTKVDQFVKLFSPPMMLVAASYSCGPGFKDWNDLPGHLINMSVAQHYFTMNNYINFIQDCLLIRILVQSN